MPIRAKILAMTAFLAVLASCQDASSYYLAGTGAKRERLAAMIDLLERDGLNPENRYSLMTSISNDLLLERSFGPLENLLTGTVERHPDDPYNAWYLFTVAYIRQTQGEDAVAARYFERVIKNYPDLRVKDESIHLASLKELIRTVKTPEQVIDYYLELLARFPSRIDMGQTLFLLGQAYERLGEWNLAIQTYTRFLPYIGTTVPGFTDAHLYARKLVDFSNSSKDWTMKSLPDLVDAVRKGITTGNASILKRYRAKVNFFAVPWAQGESESSNATEFEIADFLTPDVACAQAVDPSSTMTQAYLRTTGWGERVSTWYLYFRKIYFPADPDIHGRWEWAGIYYGEKGK